MKRAIFLALSLWTTLSCGDEEKEEKEEPYVFLAPSSGYKPIYLQPEENETLEKGATFELPKQGKWWREGGKIEAPADGNVEISAKMFVTLSRGGQNATGHNLKVWRSHSINTLEGKVEKIALYRESLKKTVVFSGGSISVKKGEYLSFHSYSSGKCALKHLVVSFHPHRKEDDVDIFASR